MDPLRLDHRRMFRVHAFLPRFGPPGVRAVTAHAWRWLVRIVLTVLGVIALYVLFAVVLGLIPLNRNYLPVDDGVTIYLASNGVHSDLVVPVRSEVIDWQDEYPTHLFPQVDARQDHLAIGWGSRGFYLNTEHWSDLTLQTAVVALSGAGSSAMHIEYRSRPAPGPDVIVMRIPQAKYRELVDFIRGYAIRDEHSRAIAIAGHHYTHSDAFFEAYGTYSAVMTCNEWTRQALAHAGVRAPAWAPLDTALFYHLR